MKLKPDAIDAEAASAVHQHWQQSGARLLDALIQRLRLKNDAALSRVLEVEAPTISKIRNGKIFIGASMLLRMHEVSDLSVQELRMLMGDRRDVFRGALNGKADRR